jgi:phospholipid/cholesterol/gamma-HCH transport system ATP-binding protein
MPSKLSGGMSRRVALARALALDPALMMFDEPFAGQDPITMGILVKLIKTLNDTLGTTTIVVSHDLKETLSIADYVYLISEGVVKGSGTPQQLTEGATGWGRQFIEGLPDGPVPFHYPAPDYADDLLGVTV